MVPTSLRILWLYYESQNLQNPTSIEYIFKELKDPGMIRSLIYSQ